jgi:lactoylglutathione lyase
VVPQLKLIVIRTMELDQLMEFYGCIGIQFKEERHGSGPRHFATDFNGMVFEIYPAKNPEDVDRTTRLGFYVSDMNATLSLLRINGDAVVEEPRESPWGLRAVVRDPDGRAVELYADHTEPLDPRL